MASKITERAPSAKQLVNQPKCDGVRHQNRLSPRARTVRHLRGDLAHLRMPWSPRRWWLAILN